MLGRQQSLCLQRFRGANTRPLNTTLQLRHVRTSHRVFALPDRPAKSQQIAREVPEVPCANGSPSAALAATTNSYDDHEAVQLPAQTWLSPVTEFFQKSPDRLTGLIMLNVMTILMGSNWVVVKHSEELLDPMVFAALRFSIAAMASFPALIMTKQSSKVVKGGLELGTYMALGYLTQSFALHATDASRASLLSTFTVLAVPLLAGLNGRKIKPMVWLCCIGSILGTSLLEQSGQPPNIGDLLSIFSAIFFGIQIYRTEQISQSLPPSSAMPVTAVAMLTVAAAASLAAVGQHGADIAHQAAALAASLAPQLHHMTWADASADATAAWHQVAGLQSLPWAELMYTGICSTVMVLMIEMFALNTVSSTEAAIIYTTEPICGALFAYWFLGERWGMLGWVGAAIITGCSLATQIAGAEDHSGDGSAEKAAEE